jgi:VanZ family protein
MALSLQRKITVVVLALYWPMLFVFAHIPIPQVVRKADVSDKGLHFLAYLVLTFLLWFAIHGDKRVNWRKAAVWWMLLLVVWYGVVDELLQGVVAGRNCDVRDFFVDVAGALTGLILFSVFAFWPAVLVVAGIFIFGLTSVARANVADLLPVTSAVFYLLAYAVFTLLWIQSLEHYWPRLRSRRMTVQWVMLALAVPAVLLVTVKVACVVLGRTFIVRDMLMSAGGIGAVVALALLATLFRRTRYAGRSSDESES